VPLRNPQIPTVNHEGSTNATSSSVNVTNVTQVSLVSVNLNRRGLTIYNNGLTDIFVDTVNTVSSSNFQFRIVAGSYYEIPFPVYVGQLFGVTATGASMAFIREKLR
jgi:hypothetical protein